MKDFLLRGWRFAFRHKVSLGELSLLAAALIAATYYAFEVDIFANPEGGIHHEMIELDEALMLGGFLVFGLLVFSLRRYTEQRRETRRRIAAEHRARELAFQDALTGLPNRRQFDDALKAAIAAPPRTGAGHGLFLLDLNGFKQINDVYGHGAGDQVLMAVAERLQGAMRDGDLIARFGGDEFAILARHLAGPEAATNVALRVIEALKPPFAVGPYNHTIGAGIGIALMPDDGVEPEELLRKADIALYRAKAEKRSALRFFEADMDRHVLERSAMETALRQAIADGQVSTAYQPSYDLQTQTIIGFEAALKWQSLEFGEVPPERFIAIAEETGLIHDLCDMRLRQACHTARQWPEPIWLAIDIVPAQLKDRRLADHILRTLTMTGLTPGRLQVEISESALVANMDAAADLITALREAGVKVALDNFGTGYSSLYHLRRVRVDKVKIDPGFIATMTSESESAAIVNALIGLGQGLGLTVAADGINDLREGVSLMGSGCLQGQGALFGGELTGAETVTAASDPAYRKAAI